MYHIPLQTHMYICTSPENTNLAAKADALPDLPHVKKETKTRRSYRGIRHLAGGNITNLGEVSVRHWCPL